MNGVYYIKNTISEFSSECRGYFKTLDEAKEALKKCSDWYRPKGTGRIYWVEFGLNKCPKLMYKND